MIRFTPNMLSRNITCHHHKNLWQKKSLGRVKDSVRNNSLNSGRRSMDAQTFATQQNLAVDFPGTKEIKRIWR